jgi:hypothetical protein
MLERYVVGVTNWSGESVGAQVPVGVARATCIWPRMINPKTVALPPIYRREGEGQKGDTNMCYDATVLGGLFPCRCPSGSIEGRSL